jgi:hypothetical protein
VYRVCPRLDYHAEAEGTIPPGKQRHVAIVDWHGGVNAMDERER